MLSKLASCFFLKSSGDSAMYLRGSSVSAPHQPLRSLPLNSEVKPGGGLSAARERSEQTPRRERLVAKTNGSGYFICPMAKARTQLSQSRNWNPNFAAGSTLPCPG